MLIWQIVASYFRQPIEDQIVPSSSSLEVGDELDKVIAEGASEMLTAKSCKVSDFV